MKPLYVGAVEFCLCWPPGDPLLDERGKRGISKRCLLLLSSTVLSSSSERLLWSKIRRGTEEGGEGGVEIVELPPPPTPPPPPPPPSPAPPPCCDNVRLASLLLRTGVEVWGYEGCGGRVGECI